MPREGDQSAGKSRQRPIAGGSATALDESGVEWDSIVPALAPNPASISAPTEIALGTSTDQ